MTVISRFHLGEFQIKVEKRLEEWEKTGFTGRLRAKDYTLWADRPEEISDRLGWLDLPKRMPEKLGQIESFAEEIRIEGFTHVLLFGMGGSSLAPEFFQKTFGNRPGYPELLVLDSTHPAAVAAAEKAVDLDRTLFIVSSKSGTTLETLSFHRYFWDRAGRLTGDPGRRFAVITDPGTPLAALAAEKRFRGLFEADPNVGGRYSALTEFGLVPAAVIGMDIQRLLDAAREEAETTLQVNPVDVAAGYLLGAALGEIAATRDKLTLLTSKSLRHFPDWLEQLIAESTGKDGRGIVPVADEPLLRPEDYGADRVFAGISLEQDGDRDLESRLDALERLGHPVIRTTLNDLYALGWEIFRWEIAVAAAGSIMGLHPFNQPDVELAKSMARSFMEGGGVGRPEGDENSVPAGDPEHLKTALEGWVSQAGTGDYIAVQAYLPPAPEIDRRLRDIRAALLEKIKLATTFGYGPRFLHSTGQLHKGGPNTGLFLQLVDEPGTDLSVPETDYSFGTIVRAQALGDYLALRKTDRRVLRIDLKSDIESGLDRILAAL
ncbi:MAG: hypothetical protein SCM96_08150 [Acidobacteriota bacterium]|nr:hypothetical protein [Acidobacteriota bacterium]